MKKIGFSGIKFIGLKLSKFLWGYGLKLWPIFLSFVVLSFIFSFVYYIEGTRTLNEVIEYSIQNSLLSNLNNENIQVTSLSRWTGYFQNFVVLFI